MAKNRQYIRQKGESGGFRKSEKQDVDLEDEETLVDIVEVKEHAQDFFERNQSLILGAITGLVLILGGYLGYKYAYQAPREQAGLEAIYKAENQFKRDSFALDPEGKRKSNPARFIPVLTQKSVAARIPVF